LDFLLIESGYQQQLWQTNLHLAAGLVRDYCYNPHLSEDALQEAKLGLWEATLTWQADMQVQFAQYAWYAMRRRLFLYLTHLATDAPRLFRSEQAVLRDLKKHMKAGELISCKLLDLLSTESGMTRFRLSQLVGYWYQSSLALSAASFEAIEDSGFEDEYRGDIDQQLKSLDQGLQTLNEREKLILAARYLEDPKKTLSELSQSLGVSIERVRQLEGNALKKLKQHLATAGQSSLH
jgi:RNA polymerase sigma-32 factor